MKQTEYERLRGYVKHGLKGYPDAALAMIANMLDDCELEVLETAIRLAPAYRGGCCKSHTD